jgi:hypothetical protein
MNTPAIRAHLQAVETYAQALRDLAAAQQAVLTAASRAGVPVPAELRQPQPVQAHPQRSEPIPGVQVDTCSDMGAGDFLVIYLPNGKALCVYPRSADDESSSAVELHASVDAMESGTPAAHSQAW